MAKFNPDYNDQPRIDSDAVCKIIRSCNTEEQLTIATGMIKLWAIKHKYDWLMNEDTKMKVLNTQMELAYEDTFTAIIPIGWNNCLDEVARLNRSKT